ncbi:hypothetical protein L1887_46369 [Cichorium endivia]|nr:hypothetical protein L1887_46369 [Cichorium endivia]
MVTNRQRYREKVSQMVSWGHWFALFNILLATVIGCRYLFVADWPTTLTGRIYSWISVVGHFSFLVFATYLLILFPLTFIVMSQRLMRFLSAILATVGMTLLLIDSESVHPLPPASQPHRLGTGDKPRPERNGPRLAADVYQRPGDPVD